MYKVSVVIPIYCVEKYIVRCAESLFNQTLKDIQFIFVDDASPDNSIALLQKTIERFPHRKPQTVILHHPKNMGLPTARATGLSHVEAPYVAHCDSDDYVDSTIYSKLYNNAIRNKSDMVICGRMTHYADGASFSSFDRPFLNKSFTYSFLYDRLRPSVWSRLTKTDIYRRVTFPIENYQEDWVQTAQLLTFSKRISFLDEPLYHYCIRPHSITTDSTEELVLKQVQKGIVNYYLMHDFLIQHDQTLKEDDFILKKQILRIRLLKTKEKCYKKKYLQTFPEINFRLLFNRMILLHQRAYHLSVLIGIHPLFYPTYTFFRSIGRWTVPAFLSSHHKTATEQQ